MIILKIPKRKIITHAALILCYKKYTLKFIQFAYTIVSKSCKISEKKNSIKEMTKSVHGEIMKLDDMNFTWITL